MPFKKKKVKKNDKIFIFLLQKEEFMPSQQF